MLWQSPHLNGKIKHFTASVISHVLYECAQLTFSKISKHKTDKSQKYFKSSQSIFSSFSYLPTLKSQKSDSAMRSEQASVASALRPGVQGPAQGPLVGSRGNAPVGVKGAKPPEAPGLVHFKNQ